MAKKSKEKLEKKIQDFFYWERERLIRMPGYKESYRRYAKLAKQEGNLEDELLEDMSKETRAKLQQKRQKIQEQVKEILKRYRTKFMPVPKKAEDWKWIMGYTKAVVKKPEPGEWSFSGLSTDNPKLFEVDIWREKEVILHQMSKEIDNARERETTKGIQPSFIGKSLKPGLIKRRLAVFDLRNQKPPVKYRDIALKLSNAYGNKSLEKMINLAIQDYKSAFELIYGLLHKGFDKEQVEQFNIKTCAKCRKRKNCKELCSDVEYMLRQADVKQQHLLGGARDAAEWGSEDEDIRDALDD